MTRQQFDALFNELLQDFDFNEFARKQAEKALNSGCIKLEEWSFEDSRFMLPKAVLNAVMQQAEWQTRPLDNLTEKEAKKIYNHL